VTTPDNTVRDHREQAWEFLGKSREYLAQDDLHQASEKGWGAAAQIVKALAEKRGWNHRHHSLLQQAVDTLAEETGDQDYLLLFSSADSLHKNFYEGKMAQATVALHLAQVTTLVEKVERRL
jgi:uncharacterized protein (UPF0332 family)